jgi:hypothetical protein
MRSDAESLLARLGRRDFRYREFADSFADMELWPIFEALLTDPRVVGRPLSKLEAREAEAVLAVRRAEPEQPAMRSPSATVTSMFDAYQDAPPPAAERGNLRDFLGHLSNDPNKRDY